MLFLTLATFSQTGGVQMVCRSMARALQNIQMKKAGLFQVLSLCDSPQNSNNKYVPSSAFKGFSYQHLRFCAYALRHAASSEVVLLGHVNLLPIAWLIKCLWPRTRIILLAHGKEVWGKMPRWKARFINRKTEVWAVSRFTKKMFVTKHQVSPDKIQVLNNCLDPFFLVPPHFDKPVYLLDRYGLKQHHQVLLTLTRLDRYEHDKGYDLVLEILPTLLEEFPSTIYILAGRPSAAEQQRLRSKVDALQLTGVVIMPGFIPEEELTDHHLLADTFVLPSSKEGFGLVFLEAAACGSSIIAGNKDGTMDAVMEGALATLIDPGSTLELTAALRKHLTRTYNDTAATLQQDRVTRRFSFSKYTAEVEELLNRINTYKQVKT